jgi:transposase-like protein
MARYSSQLLAALRHRYEKTSQPERSISRDFGVPNTTLRRIASREAWMRPPAPARDIEPAMRLLEQADALERQVDRQRGVDVDTSVAEIPYHRIPVERYAPRLLAALRRRYENSPQSIRSIAREFGVSDRTLRRIASQRGWRRPDPLRPDLEPAERLLEEVIALERRYRGLD